ncbi:MAG: KamA family radical SAM protein [Pirellulales bacterium]|nr:KamA family radical SAM protein [Pirellulales bacterium]
MNQLVAAVPADSNPGMAADDSEEPPSTSRRHDRWSDVPQELWEDWRWQMQHAIRTTSQLVELLPHSPEQIEILSRLESQYKLAIPPYYFSLINVEDPADPIRLQAVPSAAEAQQGLGPQLHDPLEEDLDSPLPGVTHRYPDRVLLVTTHVCSMYCRFCTRKRVTMDREGWDAPSHDDRRMVAYVREHPEVRDVIVSGGDPLSLPLARLKWFVHSLAEIPHVDVVRIGTRVPVTLPQRLFDPELIGVLASAGKVWIQTHFNHPREITPEAARACRNLVHAGMPVSNHSVLLRGVNDSVPIMRSLVRGLLRIKVRPYYLFHCDPVVGAGHLRTSVWKGLEIIEGLRGHVSGLAVPTYVVDGLHGAGKIPLMPNYLVSASEQAVVLRNYEGLLFRYQPEGGRLEAPSRQATSGYASLGVSNLLAGNESLLIPEGNRRMLRRLEYRHAAAARPAVLEVASTPETLPPKPTPRLKVAPRAKKGTPAPARARINQVATGTPLLAAAVETQLQQAVVPVPAAEPAGAAQVVRPVRARSARRPPPTLAPPHAEDPLEVPPLHTLIRRRLPPPV